MEFEEFPKIPVGENIGCGIILLVALTFIGVLIHSSCTYTPEPPKCDLLTEAGFKRYPLGQKIIFKVKEQRFIVNEASYPSQQVVISDLSKCKVVEE